MAEVTRNYKEWQACPPTKGAQRSAPYMQVGFGSV